MKPSRGTFNRGVTGRAWLSFSMVLPLVLWGFGCEKTTDPRPNVIWIVLDTARTDLSCYGYERPVSPNMDRLASEGVLFERHFAQATWTGASVPSYMTGRYFPAQSIGVYGEFFEYRDVRLPQDREYLAPEVFALNGYQTAMITEDHPWFSLANRLPRAFQEFMGFEPERPPILSLAELNPAIFAYVSRPRSMPFFLYVHAFDPHFPHRLEAPYDRWLDRTYPTGRIEQGATFGAATSTGNSFSEADQLYLRGLYDGSILYADAHVGLLMERLEQLGLRDNTFIVVSSDHGEALGEDGKTVAHAGAKTYDEITHVPLLLSGPGLPAGRRVAALTENVDILPTLIDLLSLETDIQTDGTSLVPLINGSASEIRDHVFTADSTLFSLRGERFRFETDLATNEDHLYPVPDRVATRVDVLGEFPEVAATMRQILASRLEPLYQSSRESPLMAIFLNVSQLFAPHRSQSPGNRVVHGAPGQDLEKSGTKDDEWLLLEGQLFAASFAEDAPQLSLREPVRRGKYNVLVEVLCDANYGGHPASSISLEVEQEVRPRVVRCSKAQQEAGQFAYIDVGEYELSDGFFDALVDEGDRDHWAVLRGFVLVPRSDRAEAEFDRLVLGRSVTQQELVDAREKLEALGYLGSAPPTSRKRSTR